MKKLSVLLFLIIPLVVSAQGYKTFSHTRVSGFSNPNAQLTTTAPATYFVSVDSFKVVGQDTIYYHFNIIRKDTNTSFNCYFKKLPNWTGAKTIIKSNKENIFLTRSKDSIRIKTNANVSDKWHLMEFSNGNYFEAEVIDNQNGSVLGLADNIKTITLTLKDNQGNSVSHDFNGKKIILSENYGLIKGYDFYTFPNDTSAFNLVGLSNPKRGVYPISTRDIYNFNVGDEFHIEAKTINVPYDVFLTLERNIILTKEHSSANDTVKYHIQILSHNYSKYYSSNTETTTNILDTLFVKIPVNDSLILNSISIKDGQPATAFLTGNSDIEDKIWVKHPMMATVENDSCLIPVIDGGYDDFSYEGLGGNYYNTSSGFSTSHRILLYYKKGSEIWGAPVDFPTLVSTKNKIGNSVIVYPNPFQGEVIFKLEGSNSLKKLVINDTQGKIVEQHIFEGSEFALTNFNYKGFYIYRVYEDDIEVASGKLTSY